jgi:hypothetical protein
VGERKDKCGNTTLGCANNVRLQPSLSAEDRLGSQRNDGFGTPLPTFESRPLWASSPPNCGVQGRNLVSPLSAISGHCLSAWRIGQIDPNPTWAEWRGE